MLPDGSGSKHLSQASKSVLNSGQIPLAPSEILESGEALAKALDRENTITHLEFCLETLNLSVETLREIACLTADELVERGRPERDPLLLNKLRAFVALADRR